MIRVTGTGHRPNKFPNRSYDWDGDYTTLKDLVTHELTQLATYEDEEVVVISGMAIGFDQILARAAVDIGIKLLAYLPFDGQQMKWPRHSWGSKEWHKLKEVANEVKVISPGGYSPRKMYVRNIAMIDDADVLISAWNGSGGGTAHCMNYAKKKEAEGSLQIIQIWPWDKHITFCEDV